jgi:hypothetical protein
LTFCCSLGVIVRRGPLSAVLASSSHQLRIQTPDNTLRLNSAAGCDDEVMAIAIHFQFVGVLSVHVLNHLVLSNSKLHCCTAQQADSYITVLVGQILVLNWTKLIHGNEARKVPYVLSLLVFHLVEP